MLRRAIFVDYAGRDIYICRGKRIDVRYLDRSFSLEVPKGAAEVGHPVVKVRGTDASEVEDHLAVEEPLEIRMGGHPFSVTMRTPGHDEDLVAGLLHAEGIIHDADGLDVIGRYRAGDGEADQGNVVNVLLKGDVSVARERLRRSLVASSSCGVCGKVTVDSIRTACPPIDCDAVVPAALFSRISAAMSAAQPTFARTGGLHAAGLFDLSGRLLVLREDIGRHNAVDKVVGHMLRSRRVPLDRHILMVSGRASFEIMQKAWMARIPMVAAVSAPSSMAVQMAVSAGMTLVGFLRSGGFNVYAGAQRIDATAGELV
jgi:FdhD protein